MRKALTLTLTLIVLGVFAAVVYAAVAPSDNASPVSGPATFTETTSDDSPTGTTTTETAPGREAGEDVRGPCDEAEHANDPRCAGTPAPPTGDDNPANDDRDDAARDRGDDRGHHAEPGDDRGGRVDNSGPGSMNSGPGSVNSGRDDAADDRGHEAEDVGDDHGGQGVEVGDDNGGDSSGHDVGDDHGGGDNSGHGGGGHDD